MKLVAVAAVGEWAIAYGGRFRGRLCLGVDDQATCVTACLEL